MSDDYSGQNSGVTFSILSSGQLQYTSSNIAGSTYVGTMEYAIRKTFGVVLLAIAVKLFAANVKGLFH